MHLLPSCCQKASGRPSRARCVSSPLVIAPAARRPARAARRPRAPAAVAGAVPEPPCAAAAPHLRSRIRQTMLTCKPGFVKAHPGKLLEGAAAAAAGVGDDDNLLPRLSCAAYSVDGACIGRPAIMQDAKLIQQQALQQGRRRGGGRVSGRGRGRQNRRPCARGSPGNVQPPL